MKNAPLLALVAALAFPTHVFASGEGISQDAELRRLIEAKEQRIVRQLEKIEAEQQALEELAVSLEKAKGSKIYYRLGAAAVVVAGLVVSARSYKALQALHKSNTDKGIAGLLVFLLTLPGYMLYSGGVVAGAAGGLGAGAVVLYLPHSKINELELSIEGARQTLGDLRLQLEIERNELEFLKRQLVRSVQAPGQAG